MVEYVDIQGKKYPIRIGYYVMKKVQEATGMSLTEALQKKKEDISFYETLLFAALQSGSFAEKTELDLKQEDMEFALDSCFFDFLKAFESEKFFPKGADVMMGKSEGLVRKEVPKKAKSKT